MGLFESEDRDNDFQGEAQPELEIQLLALSSAKTLNDLIEKMKRILEGYGVDGFFIFDLSCPAGFLARVGFLPENLAAGIEKNDFHISDLVLRCLTGQSNDLPEPMFRSIVDNHIQAAKYSPPAYKRHIEFVNYLQRFGIHDIYYFPFRACESGKTAAFCLWRKGDPSILHNAVLTLSDFIPTLAREFCRIADKKFRKLFSSRTKLILSEAQRECLRYFAEKSLNATEISEIRGVHEVTVFKQVAGVRRTLGVTTTSAAIVEAIKGGLITVEGI